MFKNNYVDFFQNHVYIPTQLKIAWNFIWTVKKLVEKYRNEIKRFFQFRERA